MAHHLVTSLGAETVDGGIGHPLVVVGEGPEGPCRLAKLPQRLAQVVAQAYREVGITTIRVEPAGASPGVLLDAG